MIAEELGAEPYDTDAGDDESVALGPEQARELDSALQEAIGLGNDPGLELLVDLAKRGECDPWDLDVVNLTDTYLAALDEILDARDLGKVARLIFYAACLIHLKAQAMAERQKQLDYEEALEQTLADEFELDFEGRDRFSPRLLPGDEPLDYGFLRGDDFGIDPARFLSPREQPVRSRGLTLVDLIFALRDYDDRLAQRELLEDLEPDFDADQALVECVGSSHQDDLEGDIEQIREELWARLGRHEPLAGIDQRVELDTLIAPGRSRPAAFLATLFLANDEEVHLAQEEFYGELWIERGPHFGEIRAGVVPDDEGREDWSDSELDEIVEPSPAEAAAAQERDAESDDESDDEDSDEDSDETAVLDEADEDEGDEDDPEDEDSDETASLEDETEGGEA